MPIPIQPAPGLLAQLFVGCGLWFTLVCFIEMARAALQIVFEKPE
jgi:hypothetical protein